MKKEIIFLSFAFALFSCTSKSQQGSTATKGSDTLTIEDMGYNGMTLFDYKGVYKGVLPTASGSGMAVTIQLLDSTYNKKVVYVGKGDKIFETKGAYSLNKEDNTITLKGDDKPNQYLVGENTLTQLDMSGKKIEGEMSKEYILKK